MLNVLKGEPIRLANGSTVGSEREREKFTKGCSRLLCRDGSIDADSVASDPAHWVPTQGSVI